MLAHRIPSALLKFVTETQKASVNDCRRNAVEGINAIIVVGISLSCKQARTA